MIGELVKHHYGPVELDGFASILPDSQYCVLHFPGLAGNFYESGMVLGVGRVLNDAGISFVSCNTRGHDYLADAVKGDEWLDRGGARTTVDEYVEDFRAWREWASTRTGSSLVLQAHSASASALAHATVSDPDARWVATVFISPADVAAQLASAVTAERLTVLRELASRLHGSREDLMPDDALPGYPISAAVYQEFIEAQPWKTLRWGADDLASEVFDRRATLATFGSEEASEHLDLQALTARWNAEGATTTVIAGAGHSYAFHEKELAERIVAFLQAL